MKNRTPMKINLKEVDNLTTINIVQYDPLLEDLKKYFEEKEEVSLVAFESQGDVITLDLRFSMDSEELNTSLKRTEGKQKAYDIKRELEEYLFKNYKISTLSIQGVNVKDNNEIEFEISFIYYNKGNNKIQHESRKKLKTFIDYAKERLIKEIEKKSGKKVIIEGEEYLSPEFKVLADYDIVGDHFDDQKFFDAVELFVDNDKNPLKQKAELVRKYYAAMDFYPKNWKILENNDEAIVHNFIEQGLENQEPFNVNEEVNKSETKEFRKVLQTLEELGYKLRKISRFPAEAEDINPIQRYIAEKPVTDDIALWQEKETGEIWVSEPYGGDYEVTPESIVGEIKRYERYYKNRSVNESNVNEGSDFQIEWTYGKENSEKDHWRFFDPETDDAIGLAAAKELAKKAGLTKEFETFVNKVVNDTESMDGTGGTFKKNKN